MKISTRCLAPAAFSLLLAACGGGAASPASTPASTPASAAASGKPAASAPASAAGSANPAASGTNAKPAASGGAIPSIPSGQKVKITTATGVPSAVFTPIWIAVDDGIFAKY